MEEVFSWQKPPPRRVPKPFVGVPLDTLGYTELAKLSDRFDFAFSTGKDDKDYYAVPEGKVPTFNDEAEGEAPPLYMSEIQWLDYTATMSDRLNKRAKELYNKKLKDLDNAEKQEFNRIVEAEIARRAQEEEAVSRKIVQA